MKNKITFIFVVFIFSNHLLAQSLDDVLSKILKNNQELKAISAMSKLEVLTARNQLIPKNPELEQEFKEDDNYEIGITQSFQFPTYYYHQYKNLQLTKAQQEAIFRVAKVKIVKEAKINLYKLQYINSRITILKNRMENATTLKNSFEKKFMEGEINQLELNQAKLHQITYENQLQNLIIEQVETKEKLKLLNGGKEIRFSQLKYSEENLDTSSLGDEYIEKNPALAIARIDEQMAARSRKIAKYGWLPDFRLGLHKEKESDPMLHYGISIPLWKNHNQVSRAKAEEKYCAANHIQFQQKVRSEFKQLSQQYSILLKKLNLNLSLNLNTHELLEKSLKTDEISIIEYYTELENLYEFEDELSKTQLDLEIVRIKLTTF